MTEVLHQPVAHVAHRGGTGRSERRAKRVRRIGTPIGLDQHPRRAKAAVEHGEPSSCPADATGEDDAVPGPGTRTSHGRIALEIAEGGDPEHHGVGTGDVATHDGRAHHQALVAQPVDELERPIHREIRGRGQPDEQRCGNGAHGDDVGEVGGGGAATDVVRRRPVPPEVMILDQQVSGGDDPAVPGPHDRGIVARAEDHRVAARQPPSDRGDQPELAELADAVGSHVLSLSHRPEVSAHVRSRRVAIPCASLLGGA